MTFMQAQLPSGLMLIMTRQCALSSESVDALQLRNVEFDCKSIAAIPM